MNRFLYFCISLFFLSNILFAQDKNFAKHTVIKGETIVQIATKYKITPHDIYSLNPDAQDGIQENDILLIPVSAEIKREVGVSKSVITSKNQSHTVKPKETLYSISRDYNVTVQDLQALNSATVTAGLKIGQTIQIPNNAKQEKPVEFTKETHSEIVVPVTVVTPEKSGIHVVEPKETKFGIAKKYGITVEELERKNPQIVSGLLIGSKLTVSGASPEIEPVKKIVEKPKPVTIEIVKDEIVETQTTRTLTKNGYANYEVKEGETLYSLTQSFHLSQEELLKLNPTLNDGVKTGMILKVPGRGTINTNSSSKPTANYSDLTKTIVTSKSKKELVLLLPLNANKIQNDSLKSLDVRLKKDAFLNMTLDFYSGALMAIDSAKTLGLNINVRIFDSEESKLSSNIERIIKDNNVQNADAVIGPFYQQYIEKTAELLSEKSVPVISPLSKEMGKSYANLFQAMPNSDAGKIAIFDFMLAKKGNIIVVNDPKKLTNKEFISKKYPMAKFVSLLDNGALDITNLKSLFVKEIMNYVVLDSERTGMILGTTNVLLNEKDNFNIQLVVLEQNNTLDFEEISMKRLTILKMLYPSFTRENNSLEANHFENAYKAKNKIFPSQFAVRGFDLTFDTLMRLAQEKSFTNLAEQTATEQIESKFDYAKNGNDGFTNKGIYILEYQEDLSQKQVN